MKLFQYLQHVGKFKILVNTRDIADDAITTDKLADNAVTEEKLSENLRTKIGMMIPTIGLGFYTDEEEPVPILSLSVRPNAVNETIVPYLLMAQQDVSSTVIEWKWSRESGNAALDQVWGNQPKAYQRKLTLTNSDFPAGWNIDGGNVAFKCSATFYYEDTIQTLINVVTII